MLDRRLWALSHHCDTITRWLWSYVYNILQHLHKEAVDVESYKAVTYMTHVGMFFSFS